MDAKQLMDNNELLPYKNKVMNILLSSPILYELCKNTKCENIELAENLIGKNYVSQLFIDDVVTDKEAYVLFDFDEDAVQNYVKTGLSTYNTYILYFHIICHKDIYMVHGIGTRCDCIVAELCRLFKDKMFYTDGSLGIGTNKKIHDNIMTSPNDKYVAREIQFLITDYDERVKMKNAHR